MGFCLVSESNAYAEEDSTKDQHEDVFGGGVDDSSEEEADGADEDASSPAVDSGDIRSSES